MTNNKIYRLLTGKHGRFEDGKPVTYRKGEEIALSPAEAESLAGRVELIGDAPEAEPAGGVADVLGGSIPTVSKHVASVKDPEALQSLRDAEVAGKNRSGVLTVIEGRLEELNNE